MHVQQLRKEADLEIEDRIRVFYHSDDDQLTAAIGEWDEYIRGETLAGSLEQSDGETKSDKLVTVGEAKVPIWIEKSESG